MTTKALSTAASETGNGGRARVGELMARVGDRNLSTGARLNCVRDVMEACKPQMFQALPRHVTPDRLIRVAMNCIRQNPALLDCSPTSLFAAITEAATYGWELGGVLGHAYLVPFKDECVLIPGYKGLLDLVHRAGQVQEMQPPALVREGDEFDYAEGDAPFIRHKPARDPARASKPVTFVYWVVTLKSGGKVRIVRSRAEIDAHKERYSQRYRAAERYRLACEKAKRPVDEKKLSSWHTSWDAMAGKTIIREAIGRGMIPLSAEHQAIVSRLGVEDAIGDDSQTVEAADWLHLPAPSSSETEQTVDPLRGVAEALSKLEEKTAVAEYVDAVTFEIETANLTEPEIKTAKDTLRELADSRLKAIHEQRGERTNRKAAN